MKGAMIQYAGALAQDLGAKGIRVNSICPGPIFIEGGAWDNIKKHMTPFYEQTVANVPLGRLGSAEEVAAQIALLASPRGGFTTGANLVIDGGFTKRIQF
jgi:3-oxoacyl-[acyl-carrier protein] reductase